MARVQVVEIVGLGVHHVDGYDWFRFSWEGPDWDEALRRLKSWVPPDFRKWDPESKKWSVRTDMPMAEICLAGIFPNFTGALETLRSQLNLF